MENMFSKSFILNEKSLAVIKQFGEHMPGGFYIYKADESEELLYANEAACRIYGCDDFEDLKAFSGSSFRGTVHPEDYAWVSESIQKQMEESGSHMDHVAYRILRKDGAVRWIDDYGHYVESDVYNGLYYVFISDITEQHEQLETDKALRTAVVEALTRVYDSVWLIDDLETQHFELFRIDEDLVHRLPADKALKIERYTDAFAFYSRLVLEEDRQKFLEGITPENVLRNTEKHLIYSVPFRRVFENGIRYYRVEFARLNLPGVKTGIVTGFKDVDNEVRKEQTIQTALREAMETGMSHDMRTPMNGIIGMATIAANHLDDRERVEDCLRKIRESSNHLLSLINEVLDMNKIESGKVELQEEEFCLADLIDGMLNIGWRPTFNGSRRTIEVHLFDFHSDIYSEQLRIHFIDFIRPEQRFDSPEALVCQLAEDEKQAREVLQTKGKS